MNDYAKAFQKNFEKSKEQKMQDKKELVLIWEKGLNQLLDKLKERVLEGYNCCLVPEECTDIVVYFVMCTKDQGSSWLRHDFTKNEILAIHESFVDKCKETFGAKPDFEKTVIKWKCNLIPEFNPKYGDLDL